MKEFVELDSMNVYVYYTTYNAIIFCENKFERGKCFKLCSECHDHIIFFLFTSLNF